jgi:peroxiredoxin
MALAAALLLALASCGQAEPAAPQTLPGAPGGLKAGQQAPDFTLELHGGGEVTLSALRGKPVVLNFYTTWCRPCQAEMPDFQAISEEYGGRISVLGISSGESRDVVDAFLARAGYSYPMAYDPGGAVSAIYGIQFIPQTWVLDADGVIVEYIPGGTDAQKLRQALDRALSPEA